MIFYHRKLLLLPEPKSRDIKPKGPKPEPKSRDIKPKGPKPEPKSRDIKPKGPKPEPKSRDIKLKDPKPVDDNKSESLAPPQTQHYLELVIILTAFMVGAILLCMACYIIVRKYRLRSRSTQDSSQTDDQSLVVSENDFFIDRLQGPEEDHHVWHIRTVGLPESVINSIAEFKYKKRDKGSVGNCDCPVCLSEFEDDERLRLLPECGHAFHLACIDNWLRSHKNCPVCRAPVIVALDGDTSDGSDEAGSSGSGFVDGEIGTEESGESRREFNVWSSKLRVVSDLGDYGRVRVMIHHQELVNKVRRSNSMS